MRRLLGWIIALMVFSLVDMCYARQIFPIKGVWDSNQQMFSLEVGYGQQWPFFFEGKKRSDTIYDLYVTIKNWATPAFTLSTILKGKLVVRPPADGGKAVLDGQLGSMYTLVNQHPFEEMVLDFSVNDGCVDIRSLRLGKIFSSGRLTFGSEPALDFILRVDDVSLAEVMQFVQSDRIIEAGGTVSGEVRIQGTIDKLQIKGRIHSYNGFIGGYGYNSARINFMGLYPLIYVENSQITQAEGLTFDVEGMLDLTDLKNLQKQLEGFVGAPLVSQTDDNLEWTFKRLKSREKGGTTELKYMIKKDESSRGDINIFGVQRKLEF